MQCIYCGLIGIHVAWWMFHGRDLELIPGNGDSIKVTDLCPLISAVFNSFNAGHTLHQFLQMLTGPSIFIIFSTNVSGGGWGAQ